MNRAQRTTDHAQIRRWVDERGGVPSTVESTRTGKKAGILRIDFPEDGRDRNLQPVDWDTFFAKFDEAGLAMLYQERTAEGALSRFCKFVDRSADEEE